MFTGMSLVRKLLSSLFDTVDRTDFNAQAAQCAAPVVNVILSAARENCVFGTDKTAGIA